MNKTLILTGGEIDIDFARNFIKNNKYNIVIAADAGLVIADKLSIIPDYIVGDFDTVNPLLMYKYEKDENVKIIRFKPEKDFTDTQIAVKKAIELNSVFIHILGGTGSRLDHTIANIYLLQSALEAGIDAMLVSKNNRIRLIGYSRKNIIIEKSEYKYVSLIPLSDVVKKITTTGMKYNIENFDMYIDKQISLGVSNEILNNNATINIAEGKLLLIESID